MKVKQFVVYVNDKRIIILGMTEQRTKAEWQKSTMPNVQVVDTLTFVKSQNTTIRKVQEFLDALMDMSNVNRDILCKMFAAFYAAGLAQGKKKTKNRKGGKR
ncbi:MAG: hypothetical protein V1902_00765 [Candidatus Falkowbacteria bacterium]